VGRLTIGPGAIVTFRDDFDNDGSGQGVRESLTVFDLTLESGANVTIEDCNVFFAALADNGATVTLVGLAAFLSTCDIPTMSQWGLIVLALLVTIAGTLVFNRPKTKSVALWRRKK
jgi:hypothetical protein